MVERCRRRLAASEPEAAEALASFAHDARSLLVFSNQGQEPADQQKPASEIPGSNPDQGLDKTGTHFLDNIPINWCDGNTNTTGQLRNSPYSRRGCKLKPEEQEERRMRRVLSNRVSARQTIIRKQAMFQELTRNAAALLEENEGLKKTKELVLKQHDMLKDRNSQLKAKLAQVSASVVKSGSVSGSGSSTSFLINPPPVYPFYCPPIHQSPLQFFIPPNPRAPPVVFIPVPCLLPFVPFGCSKRPSLPSDAGHLHRGSDECWKAGAREARWRRKQLNMRDRPHQ